MSTEVYKKLFRDNCPPQNEQERLYASIILALSEKVDEMEKIISADRKMIVKLDKAMNVVVRFIQELKAADEGEEGQSGAPQAEQAAADEGPRDETPFPTGFKASAAPTAPSPAVTVDGETVVPNAGSGPAMNAAPIPQAGKKVSTKNGSKDSVQS